MWYIFDRHFSDGHITYDSSRDKICYSIHVRAGLKINSALIQNIVSHLYHTQNLTENGMKRNSKLSDSLIFTLGTQTLYVTHTNSMFIATALTGYDDLTYFYKTFLYPDLK